MKMKKLVSLLLAVLTVFSMLQVTAFAETKGPAFDDTSCPYSDVNPSDDFYSAAIYLYYQDIMKGVSDGVFGADVKLDRGQLVTMLWRMDGAPEVDAEVPFVDCPKSKYYYDAVKWASACGVVAGVDATHFKPDQSVTEQDALLVLYRFIRDYSRYRDDKNDNYTDAYFKELYKSYPLTGFSGYAKCAAAWAYTNQILRNTNIGAKSACPRKNTANYLYRAILKYMNKGGTSSSSAVMIDTVEALFDTKCYGAEGTPAILGICQAVNKNTWSVFERADGQYIAFSGDDYLYIVNTKVFMGRSTDTWNSVSRVYPSNETIGSKLSSLNGTLGGAYQGFMDVYVSKDTFSNCEDYTVNLAELYYIVAEHSDYLEISTDLKSSCSFHFYKDAGEIFNFKKVTSFFGFIPSFDLLAMPKNKKTGDFNYLYQSEADCRGQNCKTSGLTLSGVMSTYDLAKSVVSFLTNPGVGTALSVVENAFSGKDNNTNLYRYFTRFKVASGTTNTQKADENLTYRVKETAPGVLKKASDQFTVRIYCVPQLKFPAYSLTIENGKKLGD